MPRRTWIGLALILVGASIFGGWKLWMATRTWVPLDMPISLAPGHIRSPEFRINLKEQFVIYVEVERRAQFDGGPCWLSSYVCPEQPSLVQAHWTISDTNKIVAQGGTDHYQGHLFGTVETGFRPLGDFAVPDGKHYVLDVDFLDDGRRLNAGHPRLKIGQPSEWMYEEDGPWFFLVAVVLAAIGAIPLVSAIAERALKRRNETLSMVSPGPLPPGFVIETKAEEIEAASPEPRLSLSVWVGLILLLVGAFSVVTAHYWYRTRIFEPLNMPVTLERGHIRTGPFRINLRATYWVSIEPDPWSVQPPCDPKQVDTRWHLLRDGKVIQDELEHFSSFDAGSGVYELDVEVLSDASCMNQFHPRLRVLTYDRQDTASYASNVQFMAAIGMAAGAGLIVLVLIRRRREALSTTLRLNLSPTIGQTFQWAQRMPLRRPFSGLPAFGLAGGMTFAILAILMMLLTAYTTYIHSGLPVHLLKLGESPVKPDQWNEALIVHLKDAGAGRPADLYVNSLPVAWGDLDAVLKEELGRRKDWVVYIGGDDAIPYNNVADVIDVARKHRAKVLLLTGDGPPSSRDGNSAHSPRRK